MKKTMLALTLGAMALLANDGNLLQNPSFRDDGLGGALNWRTEARLKIVPGAGPGAATAIRFPLKGTAACMYQGTFALAAGEPHRFGCHVRTRGIGGCGARLVFFNSAWWKEESLYLPDDTKGEWKKLEWSGKIMDKGPYSFGLYMAKPAADGCIELARPYLIAESEKARASAVMMKAAKPFRTRLVPIDPKLSEMDASEAKMEFFYNGIIDKPESAYELQAEIDGGKSVAVRLDARHRATVNFGAVPAGRHQISARLIDKATGESVAADEYPVVTTDRSVIDEGRRLNNFVRELLSAPLVDGEVAFDNPRDGWVYVGFEHAPSEAEGFLDGGDLPVVKFRPNEPMDTMRYMSRGRHVLRVKNAGKGGRLVVRTVKPLMISPTCERPPTTDFAAYNIGSDWWHRYLYHTFNTYSFYGWTSLPEIRYPGNYELHRDVVEYGFHVGGEARIPEASGKWGSPESLEQALAAHNSWKDGFGLLVDESSPYAPRQNMHSMAETCWKLVEDPRPISIFWNSCMYALCKDPRGQASMLSALANSGGGRGMIVPEVYLISYPTEEQKIAQERHYANLLASVRDQVPAAARSMMFCFGGYNTSGGWNGYSAPDTDMKVVIDDFVRQLAVDPAFEDLGGIAFYAMGCYQEIFRWYMDTIRHYAVLGNTESRSEKFGFTFKPGHITDNDFERGFEGWKVEPAETNSIVPHVRPDYGRLVQTRKRVPKGYGDTTLLLTRSEKRPNKVSQMMKGLKPGQRYHVSCCTMDLDDIEKPGPCGNDVTFSIRIGEGGVVDPHLVITHRQPHDRRANGNSRWGNQPVPICATHSAVFRAEREEVTLTLSDWAADDVRGGRVGQRRILNYVIVRPYYEEERMSPGAVPADVLADDIGWDPQTDKSPRRRVDWGEVLVKRLEDGDVAVGLLNPSDEVHDKLVKFDFRLADIDGRAKVRDLRRHCDLGIHSGEIMVAVPRHGCVTLRLKPLKAAGKLIFHFDFNSLLRTKEAVIAELAHVAAAGYDAVLWEIENAVRFDCCPEIAAPDAFTKKEFKEILAVAKRLGLEPIPLMQTFGHGEYVLKHDKYRPLREVAERYDCYCPSKPETRTFLKALLHEYLEIFGPDVKRFHLGGDEVWSYRSCATCKAREPLDLYLEHLEAVGAELRTKNIRPGCWHDMVVKFSRESGSRLERFKDYTVWFWDYSYPKSWHPWGQADAPLRELRAAGCETIICGSAQSWKEDPFLVRYGAHRENLAACAALARREKLSGLCVTSWTIHQGLKRLQRPLFDFAAKRYLDPAETADEDWREAVRKTFGVVPIDALDELSVWEVRYGKSDGRGWNGYKDGSVPPSGTLQRRFENSKADMSSLAAELDAVRARTASALEKIHAFSDLTPLGRTMLEAGELRLLHHEHVIKALRGEATKSVPYDRMLRHYAIEYSPESAARAVRIISLQ